MLRKRQVVIAGEYTARISGKMTVVRITEVCHYGGWWARNLGTDRRIRIKSAAKLRKPVGITPVPTLLATDKVELSI